MKLQPQTSGHNSSIVAVIITHVTSREHTALLEVTSQARPMQDRTEASCSSWSHSIQGAEKDLGVWADDKMSAI